MIPLKLSDPVIPADSPLRASLQSQLQSLENALKVRPTRVAIIGPSSSGKSTLCSHLGELLNAPPRYLDQYFHKPNTNWEPRPFEEFAESHYQLIQESHWVMDGNYSALIPQRFERAELILWLDLNPWSCVYRYVRRCLKADSKRPGRLEGATAELSWTLIRYTLRNYPLKRPLYHQLVQKSGKPCVRAKTLQEVKTLSHFFATQDS